MSAPAEPRPKFSPEIALQAAREIVADLIKDGLMDIKDTDADLSAVQLAKHARLYMDGYQIAKALDERCYWDCDLRIAEALDSFSSYAREEISHAEKAWAARNAIEPPLPVGARVKIKSGETGEITEIYKYGAAKFCVKIDGDPEAAPPTSSRRIVNFEDAQELAPAEA